MFFLFNNLKEREKEVVDFLVAVAKLFSYLI